MNIWTGSALISIVQRKKNEKYVEVSEGTGRQLSLTFLCQDVEKYCICWNEQTVYLKPQVTQGHGHDPFKSRLSYF